MWILSICFGFKATNHSNSPDPSTPLPNLGTLPVRSTCIWKDITNHPQFVRCEHMSILKRRCVYFYIHRSISVMIQNLYVLQVLHRYKYYGVSRFWHFQPVSAKMFRAILSAIFLTTVVRAGKRGLDWTYCLSTIFSSRITNILFLWILPIVNGGLYDSLSLFDFHTCSRIDYNFFSNPGLFKNSDGQVRNSFHFTTPTNSFMKGRGYVRDRLSLIYPTYWQNSSYDYETYAPPSTNGNGGLGFIGMQRCLDCDSSPVAQLKARQQAQGWASK